MERKDFLKTTLAMCGLTLVPASLIESCSKPNTAAPTNVNFTLDLTSSTNAALLNVGGFIINSSVIVIRVSSTVYNAFSAICTHQGCTLGYNSGTSKIACPCHGGMYDPNTGAVLSGPPPSALVKYNVTLNGNMLTVKS